MLDNSEVSTVASGGSWPRFAAVCHPAARYPVPPTSRRRSPMTVIDEYLANNARYAENFSGPLPMPPAKGVAIVACMDARLNVYGLLGLNDGEAHVIRNAGGVITDDEIRSLAISQRLL